MPETWAFLHNPNQPCSPHLGSDRTLRASFSAPPVPRETAYSGVTDERKQGNITTTMNSRAIIASCMVLPQLSSVNGFTSPSNIACPSPAAHPT